MIGLRRYALAVAVLLLLFGVTHAQDTVEPLVITPPSGPIGTNHEVAGFGLTPDAEYRLDVIFRDTEAVVYSTVLTADSSGTVAIALFTEPSDPLGVYDVLIYDGSTLLRSGTITITEGDRLPNAFTGTLRPGLAVVTSLTNVITADYYEFQGAAGDIITIDMTSDDFDPYILLLGADGTALTWDDSSGEGTNARIQTYTLPEEGTYLVAATSRRNVATSGTEPADGEYTLLLRVAVPSETREVQPGQIVVGEITEDMQVLSYSFEAPADAVVTIEVGSEDFDPLMHLFDPAGRVLAVDDDGGAGLNARVTDITLTEAGRYSIMIDGYRGSTGQRVIGGIFTITLDGEGFPENVVETQNESAQTTAQDTPEPTPTGEETPQVTAQVTAQTTPTEESTPELTPTAVAPTEAPPTEESSSAQGTPEPATPIETNATVEGALVPSASNVTYTFEGAAGEVIRIEINATGFDALLRLLDPSGAEIASDDDSGDGLNPAILDFELPVDGTYTVIVDGYRGADGNRAISGDFTLTVSSSDVTAPQIAQGEDALALTYGETASGTLSPDSQHPVYTFEGAAGDTVTISLISPNFDAIVSLLNASGEEIARDDDGGEGLNSLISGFTLPEDGTYTIVVDGYRGANNDRTLSGDFTVRLSLGDEPEEPVTQGEESTATPESEEDTQAAQPDATTTPAPTVQDGELTYGGQISGELDEDNQQITHTFTGSAGDIISIVVDGDGFDALVRLLDGNNNEIAFDDDSAGSLDALIEGFTLPADGTYTIVVDGYRGVNNDRILLGTYTLTLLSEGTDSSVTGGNDQQPVTPEAQTAPETSAIPEDAQPLAFGESASGALESGEAQSAFSFSASAGDIVTVDARSNDFDPNVTLLDENGGIIATDDDSGGGVQAQIAGVELPADGTYYIVVDNYAGFEVDSSFSGAFSVALSTSDAPAVVTTPEDTEPETDTAEEPEVEPDTGTTTDVPDVQALESGAGIAYGNVVEGTFTGEDLADTEAIVYSFEGQAGEVVTVSVDSEQVIDTRLFILLGDNVVANDDDSGAGFDPEVYQLALMESGTYTVIVESKYAGSTGNVQLTLTRDAPLSLDEGSQIVRFDAETEAGYARALATPLTFEGVAGERVRLTVNVLSAFAAAPTIEVSQDGELIASNTLGQGSLQVSFDFIVLENGTVNIDFSGENLTGVIEVSYESLP